MRPVRHQGRLADPGGAGHRRNPGRWLPGPVVHEQGVQNAKLGVASGEARDLVQQLGRAGGGVRDRVGSTATSAFELLPDCATQLQRVGQPAHRRRAWPHNAAALQFTDRSGAQPGPLAQFLLAQHGRAS
jgi:hypothetical protein